MKKPEMDIQLSWRAGKEFPAPPRPKLRALVSAVTAAACPGLLRVSLSFLSPKRMAEINERHLGHHGPTDVICFDYRDAAMPDDEGDTPQVELFLCPAVAAREAAKRGLPYSRELALYIVHGFLHAGGFDDLKPELKRKMRAAERRVCGKLPDALSGIFFHPDGPSGKGGRHAGPA